MKKSSVLTAFTAFILTSAGMLISKANKKFAQPSAYAFFLNTYGTFTVTHTDPVDNCFTTTSLANPTCRLTIGTLRTTLLTYPLLLKKPVYYY